MRIGDRCRLSEQRGGDRADLRRRRLARLADVFVRVAEAIGQIRAQQEHQQSVVLPHPSPDALSLRVEHRFLRAVDGAVEGMVDQPMRGLGDPRIPRRGKILRAG